MNQTERAWAIKTADIAGFASPWTSKEYVQAYAYPTALNFSDALKGFKGKRKSVVFHMLNRGEAGKHKCAYCGGKLNAPALAATKEHGNSVTSESPAAVKVDEHSTWIYAPGRGITGGQHYVCSWSNLLGNIYSAGRRWIS